MQQQQSGLGMRHPRGAPAGSVRLRWLVPGVPPSYLHASRPAASRAACGPSLEASTTRKSAPRPQLAPWHPTAAAQQRGHLVKVASLSRVLLAGPPLLVFRTLATRRFPLPPGPVSLLLFLASLVFALLAALRGLVISRAKACQACHGFGITRCRLCDGHGSCNWQAKFSYKDVCPLCMTKRFVSCSECGGHYHRPLFSHMRAKAKPGQARRDASGLTRPPRD